MKKQKLAYSFLLFLLLACAMYLNTPLSAASFEKTQSSITSELKSGSSTSLSGTQSSPTSQQSVTTSMFSDVSGLSQRQDKPQATFSPESAFPVAQSPATFNQPKTATFGANARYVDISMKQGIPVVEHTVKSGDTSFLKKHIIRSPGDKTPTDNGESQKYLSYDGQDLADHYKDRTENDVVLIYK